MPPVRLACVRRNHRYTCRDELLYPRMPRPPAADSALKQQRAASSWQRNKTKLVLASSGMGEREKKRVWNENKIPTKHKTYQTSSSPDHPWIAGECCRFLPLVTSVTRRRKDNWSRPTNQPPDRRKLSARFRCLASIFSVMLLSSSHIPLSLSISSSHSRFRLCILCDVL